MLKFTTHVILLCGCILLTTAAAHSQDRTITGYYNNADNPTWGGLHADQLQVSPYGFEDQMGSPAGSDRPNPRTISNVLFDQDGLIMDPLALSDYAWVWGQFIDHDITLVGENHAESFPIPVPAGDVYFDPQSTGVMEIHVSRSAYRDGTGEHLSLPRQFPNGITAFVDASGVYGSEHSRANWLRTFEDGKLKTSSGNMLPYNTTTGEIDGPVDPNAPEMAMAGNPFATNWFIAGDIRANENILLASMHTLFVREHNRLCDLWINEDPSLTDEELYQKARKMVGAIIQNIVYNEWLPTLGVHLPAYNGYDRSVNPGIMNEFSAAAYRYGHTVISSEIVRLDERGDVIPEGNIKLRDAFFRPSALITGGGVEPLFRGMATQVEQDFDTKMIDDLRNFLFGAPGSGGLDLAAMNIQRGRERGLSDYNTIRQSFGLDKVESFDEMSSDPYLNNTIASLYNSVDQIDPWVGFLAEDHMDSALFGESVMAIVQAQFEQLRDGDRFYYRNDYSLTPKDLMDIEASTLGAVILRNSDVANLQSNVFLAEPMTVVGVEDALSAIDVSIYPNPSDGMVYIEADMDIESFTMYDVAGRIVLTRTISQPIDINEIDVSDLSPGLYMLSCQNKASVVTQQIMVY